jgi:hypothetical protein
MRKPPLLASAAVLGIGLPGVILFVFWAESWDLPAWLAVSLPIIFIGSVRGTAVLLGWRALRWAGPRIKGRWHKSRETAD